MKIWRAICMWLLLGSLGFAQWRETSRIAVFGGMTYLRNLSALPIFLTNAACGRFGNGTAIGQWGALRWEYRIADFPVFLSLQGGYYRKIAQLEAVQQRYEVFDPVTGTYQPLVLRYEYQAALHYVTVDAGIVYQPPWAIPLRFRLAFDAGMPLLGTAFETYEAILSPAAVRFPDGTRRHLLFAGEVPQPTTSYGVSGAVGIAFPLSTAVAAVAEVGYRYGLNSVLRDMEWRIHHVMAGVGIQYRFLSPVAKPRKQVPPKPPTPTPPPPPVVPLSIARFAIDTVHIRQTVVTETFPLLPYIFFDSASATLPQRYRWLPADKEHFREQQLPRSMMPIYYALLSIVGKRLQQLPDATLRIVGIARSDEAPTVAAQEQLARARAAAVADFLIRHWQIDPARLRVQWRFLPAFASSEVYPEGWEENRRVELASNNPMVLAPVVHSHFFEYYTPDTALYLRVTIHPREARIVHWNAQLYARHKLLQQKEGNFLPNAPIALGISQQMLQHIGESPKQTEVRVAVQDGTGRQAEAIAAVPIRISRDTIELSRLTLVVFDFDRYELTPANQLIIRRFVSQAIRPQSRIRIIGSTDRLGEMAYNMELSQKRAESVAKFLRQITGLGTITEVKGIGPSNLRYDNSLPEGRYYCRTVLIEVRNPIASSP